MKTATFPIVWFYQWRNPYTGETVLIHPRWLTTK